MNRPSTASGLHTPLALPQEEQARADFYALISRLLLSPPDAQMLNNLAIADALAAGEAGNPLEQAWEKLVLTSGVVDADCVREEFDTLFISTGTPLLNPYASMYLAGFMMEKPLAALRTDLARLGLARNTASRELEDHLGALCEVMRLLITGAPGMPRQPLAAQQAFFKKHIASWYARCLTDMRRAPGANFYQRLADFIEAFFEVETQAFEMDEACDDTYEMQ